VTPPHPEQFLSHTLDDMAHFSDWVGQLVVAGICRWR